MATDDPALARPLNQPQVGCSRLQTSKNEYLSLEEPLGPPVGLPPSPTAFECEIPTTPSLGSSTVSAVVRCAKYAQANSRPTGSDSETQQVLYTESATLNIQQENPLPSPNSEHHRAVVYSHTHVTAPEPTAVSDLPSISPTNRPPFHQLVTNVWSQQAQLRNIGYNSPF